MFLIKKKMAKEVAYNKLFVFFFIEVGIFPPIPIEPKRYIVGTKHLVSVTKRNIPVHLKKI